MLPPLSSLFFFFFFNDTATTEIYTLSLHDALPIVLARSLDDLDASAIVNSFAYQAGLIATRDGIAVERRERNPYVNIIAVHERDRAAPWVAALLRAYQSEPVRQFIVSRYQGSVLPAF